MAEAPISRSVSRTKQKQDKDRNTSEIQNGHIVKSGVKVIQGDEKVAAPAAGWEPANMKKKMRFIERNLMPGLGEAVAQRTILRKDEKWVDVATRVAQGNTGLLKKLGTQYGKHRREEFNEMR